MTKPPAAQLIASLYEDPVECARLAQLRYVNTDEPGLTRIRRGRGFAYRDANGATIADAELKERITKLAIPPAWRNVWICASGDGHILAIGEDERERRQYIYHERWRSLRDQLNFYRLIGFGEALPAIRADVDRQLARRTLDAPRVLAAMLRIIDLTGIRVGNEVYAEENASYGLSTLTKKHVQLRGGTIRFCFPAKSGRLADLTVRDPGVARVLALLLDQRSRWLFSVGGSRVDADEINARLAELSGAHLTAKDFRTWHGTATAFRYLRRHLPAGDDAERHVLAAVDDAAETLRNTRAVARGHYVHPDVIDGYTSGDLERFVASKRIRGTRWLDVDERLLLGYLAVTLERRASDLAG